MNSRNSHSTREELDNILAILLLSLPIVMASAYLVYQYFLKNKKSGKNNFTPKSLISDSTSHQSRNRKKITDKNFPTTALMESGDDQNKSENDREISAKNTNFNKIRPAEKAKKNMVQAIQIKSLIKNRNQEKLIHQEESRKQAALEAEENKRQKQKWAEQRALEKQRYQSSSESSDSEKNNNSPGKEILEPEIIFMSPSRQAKINIKKHSTYLCGFDKNPITDDNSLIKTLAFLYHFHRYNICRRILYAIANKNSPDSENKTEEAVHLRTQIVHAANKISLNLDTILSSQEKMKEWIPAEVGNLRQIGSNIYVKSDHIQLSLFNLSGTSAHHVTFETMQTLPLYQELYQLDQFDNQANSPANVTKTDFLCWMNDAVIPFLSRCNKTDPEAMDAAKMLIIIFGEYCTPERKASVANDFRVFINSCRLIRNSLAHDVFEVANEVLENLLVQAATIHQVTGTSNDAEYTSLLTPVKEATINADSTMQI